MDKKEWYIIGFNGLGWEFELKELTERQVEGLEERIGMDICYCWNLNWMAGCTKCNEKIWWKHNRKGRKDDS